MMNLDNGTMTIELLAKQYKKALIEIIENFYGSDAKYCKVVIDAASAKGDNFMGIVYRATIKGPKGKELRVILKLPPQNQARRDQFFARPLFRRESLFYDELQPMFEKFQIDRGIDVAKEGFNHVAACFKSLTENLFEGLFMEDIKVSGFEMFDRLKEVTADHLHLVMEALAKFHAISFAIKVLKPELLEPYKAFQREITKDQLKVWYDSAKKQAEDTLNDNTNEDLKVKVGKVLKTDFFELIEESISVEAAEPYTVVSHGDCWNNNMMFRYEVITLFKSSTKIFHFTFNRTAYQLRFVC